MHEIVALEILVVLLEGPDINDAQVKLGIAFLKECGQKLCEVSPHGLDSIFSTLRDLLRDSSLDQHTQSMIEVLFAMRRDRFSAYPSIPTGLDLVHEKDQHTHMIAVDDECEPELMLGMIYNQ